MVMKPFPQLKHLMYSNPSYWAETLQVTSALKVAKPRVHMPVTQKAFEWDQIKHLLVTYEG